MKENYCVFGDGKYHLVPDDLIGVIDDLTKEYKKSVNLEHVRKKKAYAIYQVWKKYDEKEKGNNGKEDSNNEG